MLKHTVNNTSNISNTERSNLPTKKNVIANGPKNLNVSQQQDGYTDLQNRVRCPEPETQNRIKCPEPETQNRIRRPESEIQNRIRCPELEIQNRIRCVEPEYQNTRIHSPSSEFYRDTNLNKSVRSVENVCSDGTTYSKYRTVDPHWNRIRSIDTLQNARLPSRGSILNHSYAGSITPHAFPICSQQQRLNQSELASFQPPLKQIQVPTTANVTLISNGPVCTSKVIANGGLHISKPPEPVPLITNLKDNSGTAGCSRLDGVELDFFNKDNNNNNNNNHRNCGNNDIFNNGIKEILTSLGLLCLISLLLALLSLIFLLKISPVTAADMKDLLRAEQFTIISPDEYVTVYEVTLALCALSLSLNLCCLLVCSVQFLFAVKLTRSSINGDRTNKYLQKSAVTRVCAIAGFFISIPVFLTGVILYTFIQFHSTPAIITSVLIGSGIVFCGCAMVHNVFVWQKEKTNAVRAFVRRQRLQQQLEASKQSSSSNGGIGLRDPNATTLSTTITSLPPRTPQIDLSSVATTPHELSTLV